MPRVKVNTPTYTQSVKSLTPSFKSSKVYKTANDGTFTWLIVLIACIIGLMIGLY